MTCLIIIFMQGGEGDCFYVVGSGVFEVLAKQVLINIFQSNYLMLLFNTVTFKIVYAISQVVVAFIIAVVLVIYLLMKYLVIPA